MKPAPATLAAALLLTLTAGLAGAGQAEVRFVDAEHYRDAGFSDAEIKRTTDALGRHLRKLAATLPAEQTLQVDVLDVDLAGWLRWQAPREIRVVTGGADWPRIKLRYTLQSGARTLASGEETIADMNYAWQTGRRRVDDEPYGYETRLLDRWFEQRFTH